MTFTLMDSFNSLWSSTLSAVADFLMVEPICYLTGLVILSIVILLVKRICSIGF